MKHLVRAVLLSLIALPAWADVHLLPQIRATNEIGPWSEKIIQTGDALQGLGQFPATGYAECAPVTEVPNTVLCGFYDGRDMTRALGRASIYSEGAGQSPKGTLANLDNKDYLEHIDSPWDGLDIKKKAFEEFYKKNAEACEKAPSESKPNVCLTQQENEIYRQLIIPMMAKENFVVITFGIAVHSPAETDPEKKVQKKNFIRTVSHEIIHAQYFLQTNFKSVVDLFWQESVSGKDDTEGDKHLIAERLKIIGYDTTSDKELLRNEFSAFLLQTYSKRRVFGPDFADAIKSIEPNFPDKKDLDSLYRDALFKALAQKDLVPVTVQ